MRLISDPHLSATHPRMKHVERTPVSAMSASIRSMFCSTRSCRVFHVSRGMTPFRFSTWNQSSTSIDMAARGAEPEAESIHDQDTARKQCSNRWANRPIDTAWAAVNVTVGSGHRTSGSVSRCGTGFPGEGTYLWLWRCRVCGGDLAKPRRLRHWSSRGDDDDFF